MANKWYILLCNSELKQKINSEFLVKFFMSRSEKYKT